MIRLILALFATTLLATPPVELFLYWQWHRKGTELFERPPNVTGELPMLPWIAEELASRGIPIKSWELDAHRSELLSFSSIRSFDDALAWLFPKPPSDAVWVFWSLGPHLKSASFKRHPKEQLILYLWEPPTVEEWSYLPAVQEQFGKIFTWDDDLVDNTKFFKFFYPEMRQRTQAPLPFAEKKFCTMVATRLCSKHVKQLYTERENLIRFFENKPDLHFDLYGRNWEKRKFKNWRGPVADKLATIRNYKFTICYENMRDVKGYITEKIFDCFVAGTVPVYLGASNITEWIPAECFVDRREFASDEALVEFLSHMSQETYEQYVAAAEKFLGSETAKLFSVEHFVHTFVNAVARKNEPQR